MSEQAAPEMVTLTIDDVTVSVPKGTQAIRAAEAAGIVIPRFCDHPLLEPMGACRACMVEIVDMGNGRGFPKPQPSCTTEVANGMILKSGVTSAQARGAQQDILELLLINHPLDCPVCDKGGECPLQNQALASGRGETRYDGLKRTYDKPIPVSDLVLLDRERCVLCARCTRFSDQISGDRTLTLMERGAAQQVGTDPGQPYDSYYSGNVVQICPVGALTSADYRFSARPFDLVSTVTTCENCASGCELRADVRGGVVRRRLAGDNPAVNEEWSCDRGRFGFVSTRGDDRVTTPMVRQNGELVAASWPEAIAAAAAGLSQAGGSVGVLTGGRLTRETAYAYSVFARRVLRTNSIDFRAREASKEEAGFLAEFVAGTPQPVTYADLETATKVVMVMFEPEDESPMVFLRLRKAVRRGVPVEVLSSYASRGTAKLGATLTPVRPYDVPRAIRALAADAGTIILAGERLAQIPGCYTALAEIVRASGARVAWIPRRAGELGALDAGCLPGLLPGGRPLTDPAGLADAAAVWGAAPSTVPGYDGAIQVAAAARGELKALVIAGVEAADCEDPETVAEAVGMAFTVSLEARWSDIAKAADVVLPVGVLEETTGSFLNWEHRVGPVAPVVRRPRTPLTEIAILAWLAKSLGTPLGFDTAAGAAESLGRFGPWTGVRPAMTPVAATDGPTTGVVMATWRELIDDSRCLDGATHLLATARPVVARISPQTLRTEGLATSTYVRLTGPKGSVTFPLHVEATMADGVIWAPTRARGDALTQIGVHVGVPVTLAAAPGPKEGEK